MDRNGIKSIRVRWMFGTLGVVILLVLIAFAIFAFALTTNYYASMQTGLESRAKTATDFFRNFNTENEYRQNAENYTASFEEKDILELQFISSGGRIQYSAYGLNAGMMPGTPDINTAISEMRMSLWSGRDPITGERVMAVSSPLVFHDRVMGVMRFVTSMERVDAQITLILWLALAVGLFIIAFVFLSNRYMVRSIVEPVAQITETAKRIAGGSYGVQIQKKFDDEIGTLTDTINDMSIKIGQSERLKAEFLSSVSHELRTPLTAITGWSETLAKGELQDPEDVKKGLQIIHDEAVRLTTMVEELLAFSRISDGRFTLQMEPVDIRSELEDAVYTYREYFRRKGIALTYQDSEEEIPTFQADPERLRQVLSNLLDNAAKHGGGGGRIVVSVIWRGNQVAISIRDFGPGIPKEEIPHVKLMFYKGPSQVRGSGIGLAVCDEIVRLHGGTLDITNAEGGGLLATILLPITPS